MSVECTKIEKGVRLWLSTKDPTCAWLELSRKAAKGFLKQNAFGLFVLAKIPPPWGSFAWAAAEEEREQIKKSVGRRGVMIKINSSEPALAEVRKRTKANRRSKPQPW